MLLQDVAENSGRYVDWAFVAAILANFIAVIALFKDRIIEKFTKSSIDFYDVGTISIYFGINGTAIEVIGTVLAINADQFVRTMKATVIRARDNARHDYVWRSSRVPSLGPGGTTSSFAFPASFMVPSSQGWYIDAVLVDKNNEERLNRLQGPFAEEWLAVLDNEFTGVSDTPAGNAVQASARDEHSLHHTRQVTEEIDRLFQGLLESDLARETRLEIDRQCYWEEGNYLVEFQIVTARPENTYKFSCPFKLDANQERRLRGNSDVILLTWGGNEVPFGREFVARSDLECTPFNTHAHTSDTSRHA